MEKACVHLSGSVGHTWACIRNELTVNVSTRNRWDPLAGDTWLDALRFQYDAARAKRKAEVSLQGGLSVAFMGGIPEHSAGPAGLSPPGNRGHGQPMLQRIVFRRTCVGRPLDVPCRYHASTSNKRYMSTLWMSLSQSGYACMRQPRTSVGALSNGCPSHV